MNTADSIWATLTGGDLDLGELCLGCGAPTTHACAVWAMCERSYSHVSGGAQLSIGGIPVAESEAREEVRGRNVVVPLPIRLCESCAQQLLPGRIASLLEVVGFLLAIVTIGIVFLALLWPFFRLTVPLTWSLYALAAAVLIWLIRWRIDSRCAFLMRATASKVAAYKKLLDEYPDANLAIGAVTIDS
jgi:uncharacterized membrane protein YqjE